MSNTYKTYRYWRFDEEKLKTAGVCAAIEVETSTREAMISYSFCSPNERRFDKKQARMIADGRLDAAQCEGRDSAVMVVLPKDMSIGRALDKVVFGDALCDYMLRRDESRGRGERGRVPRWAIKATGCDQRDSQTEE